MDKENRLMGYATIGLLLIVIGMLFFLNHQLDSVKHAVGVKESAFEQSLHNELAQPPEKMSEPAVHSESGEST